MDFKMAKKWLPVWAKGLADEKATVAELRAAVKLELFEYRCGNNPLSQKQVTALEKWLSYTER